MGRSPSGIRLYRVFSISSFYHEFIPYLGILLLGLRLWEFFILMLNIRRAPWCPLLIKILAQPLKSKLSNRMEQVWRHAFWVDNSAGVVAGARKSGCFGMSFYRESILTQGSPFVRRRSHNVNFGYCNFFLTPVVAPALCQPAPLLIKILAQPLKSKLSNRMEQVWRHAFC